MSPCRAFSSSNWRVQADPERTHCERQQPLTSRKEDTSDTGSKIYFGNMLYTAQKQDVEQFLAEEGFRVVNIDFSVDPFTSRNPSYCFVELDDAKAAASAMRILPGKSFLGRSLRVGPYDPKGSKSHRQRSERLETSRWNSSFRERNDTPHDASPDLSSNNDLPTPMREQRRLYVGNLPRPVDNHTSDLEIRELFKDFNVEAVSKIKWPSRGSWDSMRCYAFVDLGSVAEAQRAKAQMHGRNIWGRELLIRLANIYSEKEMEPETQLETST